MVTREGVSLIQRPLPEHDELADREAPCRAVLRGEADAHHLAHIDRRHPLEIEPTSPALPPRQRNREELRDERADDRHREPEQKELAEQPPRLLALAERGHAQRAQRRERRDVDQSGADVDRERDREHVAVTQPVHEPRREREECLPREPLFLAISHLKPGAARSLPLPIDRFKNMHLYQDYLAEIEERKAAGLHPKPIDGAELLAEIIAQIKDPSNEHRKQSLDFLIYNTLPGTTSRFIP